MREPNHPSLSPCISLCGLNSDGFCRGCFRTMEEISQWRHLADADKRHILKQLPTRQVATSTWVKANQQHE
ncbi:DUF1289 domain-containing protein [Shewanella sp. NIFS-20-20]|uniref:DUF1289 domain-containing protein n=1 Tax=Shewanella sp. NIFS-20-20 TaxID=2853806 RepID=UPI001C49495E|nr:DUF1289 domain-containing protein [Shewanella sp. NIFS-20-20]MBV7316538.1 DUF1289 domain-containing protein [Shewanella sp. NIFS-20-20]